MPTQQAFEGDTLEAALARVNEEVGPSARITQAEKVRTGGIAGFFARERYEVIVEIDDLVGPLGPAGDPPRAVDVSAEDTVAPTVPASLLDLAEQVNQTERSGWRTPSSDQLPTPSTETKTFQEVLRGIASEAGLSGRIPAEVGDDPASPSPSTAAGADSAAGAVVEPTQEPQTSPAVPSECHDLVPEPFRALGVPDEMIETVSDQSPSDAQRLLRVLERLPSACPLVARRGEVVAVVGEEPLVMAAAGLAAAQLGQTIDDVVVAGVDKGGFNTLSSPDDAADRACLWRRCGVPFIVAVCTPPGADESGWVRQMLDALTPVAVWAAVRADRKSDDVVAWVDRIGGADALAVGACAETVSPAALLGTGIPVACLEGRRATPAAWTALLVERLSA